jgi:hypothetical protein
MCSQWLISTLHHIDQDNTPMHSATDIDRSLTKRFPSPENRTSASSPSSSVRLSAISITSRFRTNVLIHQGANDSRLPDTPGGPQQNVPLDLFTSNLHAILSHPHLTGRPDLRIVLITPPPVDERMLRAADSGNIPGYDGLRRTAETTARYVEAVRQVGKERGVQVCDVWSAMMREAGWEEGSTEKLPGCEDAEENAVLRRFFSDGRIILVALETDHFVSTAD